MKAISINPIGWVDSVFKEKFGTPRQSGVVPSAEGIIHFYPPYDHSDAFEEIEGFSHLWIISQFHLIPEKEFRAKVRPPKLGGIKKVGVFASRAPYRPNRLCLSVVKLEEVIQEDGKISLRVSGLDLVDQSPIIDVKPYLPYADAHPEALTAFGLPQTVMAKVFPEHEGVFKGLSTKTVTLITETLQAQPEPAYATPEQDFGLTISDYNVSWKKSAEHIIITEVKKKS